MENSLPLILGAVVLGLLIGYWVRNVLATRQTGTAEKKVKQSLEEAESRARKIVLGAEEKATALLTDAKDGERRGKKEAVRYPRDRKKNSSARGIIGQKTQFFGRGRSRA